MLFYCNTEKHAGVTNFPFDLIYNLAAKNILKILFICQNKRGGISYWMILSRSVATAVTAVVATVVATVVTAVVATVVTAVVATVVTAVVATVVAASAPVVPVVSSAVC